MTTQLPLASRRKLAGRAGGFTLVEMLVTLTLLGILAAIAVPSFNEAFMSNRLASFSNSFVASATLAKSEAIKRNASVKMCRSSNGTSCATSGGWQQGWIVFADNGAGGNNNNGAVDSDETRILYHEALSTDFSFTGDAYTFSYQPSGLVTASVNLVLCRLTPSPGSQERAITVSTTGRASVTTTRNGTCG